jgi:hypothetical protein
LAPQKRRNRLEKVNIFRRPRTITKHEPARFTTHAQSERRLKHTIAQTSVSPPFSHPNQRTRPRSIKHHLP